MNNIPDNNKTFISITDFPGAIQGKNNDSTTAFESAYATGMSAYVPYGEWFTHNFNPHLLFGPGKVYSDDDFFSDSGVRPIPPFPSINQQYTTFHETRGNAERAVGRGKIINNPNARVQVSKFSTPSQYATYPNSDHVGEFLYMHAPRNFISTTSTSTRYTEFSITAPEITANANIQVGDFVNTTHSPRYKGKIVDINFESRTAIVDGWYAAGNTSPGQVPNNNYPANINRADKIWARNDVVNIDQHGLTATGYELGFNVSVQPGVPIWGFHAVNYGSSYALDHAFRATGMWRTGLYADSNIIRAVRHEVGDNDHTTIRTEDTASDSWTGAVIDLQTNYRKGTSYLLKITTGGVTHFSIDSRGQRSAQIESYGVISTNSTLSGLSPSEISCINVDKITLTLSSINCNPGQKFCIRAMNGDVFINEHVLNTANGRYIEIMYDGTSFIKRFQAS